MYNELITSYPEQEHNAEIHQVNPERIRVIFEPELMALPRYPADSYAMLARTSQQEALCRDLLGVADIIFDFDYSHRQDLPDLAPNVFWIQSTSAEIG